MTRVSLMLKIVLCQAFMLVGTENRVGRAVNMQSWHDFHFPFPLLATSGILQQIYCWHKQFCKRFPSPFA